VYEVEQELAVLRPKLALAEQEAAHRMGLINTAKQKLVNDHMTLFTPGL